MKFREVIFSAHDEQLDQLRYALVDRVHELERPLAEKDCDECFLQSALDHTKQVIVTLKIAID